MKITINPMKITSFFLICIFLLFLANLFVVIMKYYFDHGRLLGMSWLFDLDRERNIPSLYSSLSLTFCAVTLFAISFLHKLRGESFVHWFSLGCIFIYLGLDEFAVIHEELNAPVTAMLDTSGIFTFAWVIPYFIVVLLFVLFFYRFVFSLPSRIKYLFILSAVIFLMGALGFELIGAYYYEKYGFNNVKYAFISTTEETLEMLGVALFIYALFSYIKLQFSESVIFLNSTESQYMSDRSSVD